MGALEEALSSGKFNIGAQFGANMSTANEEPVLGEDKRDSPRNVTSSECRDIVRAAANGIPFGAHSRTMQSLDTPKVVHHTFTTSKASLRGCPIQCGDLFLLGKSPEPVKRISLAVYDNGFVVIPQDEKEDCLILTPFAFVRTCAVVGDYTDLRVFKVSLFTQQRLFVFGVSEADIADKHAAHDADMERSWWVLQIAHSINLVTRSLFPDFTLQTETPPMHKASTRHLLGGYLLHHAPDGTVAVLYAELYCHLQKKAMMVLHPNEASAAVVDCIPIRRDALILEYDGIDCTCFSLNRRLFAARSVSEKTLWVRAVTNLKVRLINNAPDPDPDQLEVFREEIRTNIELVQAGLEKAPACGPLLTPTETSNEYYSVNASLDVHRMNSRPGNAPSTMPCGPKLGNEQGKLVGGSLGGRPSKPTASPCPPLPEGENDDPCDEREFDEHSSIGHLDESMDYDPDAAIATGPRVLGRASIPLKPTEGSNVATGAFDDEDPAWDLCNGL